MRYRSLVLILALVLSFGTLTPLAASAEAACGTHTWHYDGGKSIPFEQELRVQATDGCHTYDLVGTVAREALNGKNSGSGTVEIGPSNYPWDAGSTVPDPGSVGYCQYAAAQSVHGVFKYHFTVASGSAVEYHFDCTHPAQ